MTPDKLVRMANEIAAFFRPYPAEEARAGIREHVEAFWTPRMRGTLEAHLAAGAAGLDPLAAAALRQAEKDASPIARGTAGPETVGDMASDAG